MNMQPAPLQPVIDAGRFDLRPLRPEDEGPMSLCAGDARVAAMTRSIPHPMPPGAVAALIARAGAAGRSSDTWVMDAARCGGASFMGLIELTPIDTGQSEVFFWVAPAFWNAGVASQALTALIAANPHGAKTLFAEVFQDNPASARVLTNAGFQYLGDAETYSVARGGQVATWTYTRNLT